MKTFEYVAVTVSGRRTQGIKVARDEIDLDKMLDEKGLVLIDATILSHRKRSRRISIARGELVTLTTQLATVSGAGVPIVEGLEGIGERLEHHGGRDLVQRMVADLRAGHSLSESMEAQTRVFPPVYLASIRAGESSGALDLILERLARYLEWAQAMRATAVQALIYPTLLLLAIIGLIALLLLFVLPRIMGLFPPGSELPWQTQVVLGVSSFLRHHIWQVGGLLALLGGSLTFLWRDSRGKLLVHTVLLKLPKVGPLVNKLAMSRFASTASTLQAAGCDVFTILKIASDTCGNSAIAAAFERSVEEIRHGKTMSEAFEQEGSIDPLLVQMVHVGEQAGALDVTLEKLAHYYDEEIPRAVKKFLSFLEPSLLLGSGAVVTFILLSALLPMFELYESI